MWFRRILTGFGNAVSSGGAEAHLASDGPGLRIPPQALRQLNRLQLVTARSLPGYGLGSRPSLRRKLDTDFREHRMYTPGDDARFVDWNASARQEHIFVRQGEHLKEATVYVLMDYSASMNWGSPPKSGAALRLAAALSYLALSHADRLVISPLSVQRGQAAALPRPLGPLSGKGQFPNVVQYLQAARFRGQVDVTRSLLRFSRRDVSRGGLVLLVSDLLAEEDLRRGLEALPAPTWEVVVLHLLHPAEINPDIRGEFEMQDVETGQKKKYDVSPADLEIYRQRMQDWQDRLEQICHEKKAAYTVIPSDWALEETPGKPGVISRLRALNVVKPL